MEPREICQSLSDLPPEHSGTQLANVSETEIRVCLDDGTLSSELVQSVFHQDIATVTRILDEQPELVNSSVANYAETYRSWKLGDIKIDGSSTWPSSPHDAKLQLETEPLLSLAINAYSCKVGKRYVSSVPNQAVKVVELLVQRGVTVREEQRETLIGDMCYRQDSASIIELLARAGANPLGQCMTIYDTFLTAVEIAAKTGCDQSLAWLLDFALSKGRVIADYLPALHMTAYDAHENCLLEFPKRGAEKLINRRVQPSFWCWTAASTVPWDAERGHTPLTNVVFANTLRDKALNVEKYQRAWLMDSSTAKRERYAWKLLETGAETDIRHANSNKTLIYGACKWASPELVSHIIDHSGHDLDETFHYRSENSRSGPLALGGDSVGYLHVAAMYFNAEVVNTLISKGIQRQTDQYKRTPLHWLALSWEEFYYTRNKQFCRDGDDERSLAAASAIKTATYLIDNGLLDINAQDSFGRTPLHYACYNLMSELITFLVSRHADINLKDLEGCTPLHLLAYETDQCRPKDDAFPVESTAACFKTFNQTINVDAKDALGDTPLLKACKKHALNIAKLLLALGANPNIRGSDSCAPLHYAVSFPAWTQDFHFLQRPEVKVEAEELKWALLAAGADETARNARGQTVAEVELVERLSYQQKVIEVKRIMERPVKPYMGRGQSLRIPRDPVT